MELSDAAPVERPPLDTAETTEEEEEAGDNVAVVEEVAAVDVNRSPDSISVKGGKGQSIHAEKEH